MLLKIFVLVYRSGSKLGHLGKKLGHQAKLKENFVSPL